MRRMQVFENGTDQPLILFLEPYTTRYRVMPGEAYTLFYDDSSEADGSDAPLRIVHVREGENPQISIYTDESDMYLADGTEAVPDYTS